ncbi:pickpocket protein 28 [Aedes aegypti]|uniref:Uncharacterized protein n=1 Tax=Aedes aegypti TaxID=7159 RepID=A0A1S4FSE9_AEDAE|nr:pickpocket protein 28 [Aedes aegypti]
MKRLLVKCWTEFCNHSSVNALRYPFDGRLPKLEQCWWRLSFLAFIVAYCFIIGTVYFKWITNPAVITYTRSMYPIWVVPFPAVTICPMTKVRVEDLNLTDVMIRYQRGVKFEGEEYEKIYTLAQVCPFMWLWYKPRELINKSSTAILKNISLSINDLFTSCYWRNMKIPCEQILSPIMTDSGLCYTFNQFPTDQLLRKENLNSESFLSNTIIRIANWNMESGYAKNAGIDSYPFRPIAHGYRSGLSIVMKTRKIDKEYLCEGPNKGFQISVHPPDEYRAMSNRYFRLPLQQALLLTVKPQLTTISPDLKKHDHTRRQCYFNDERYLRFFKIYNSHNCYLECIANLTDTDCHCDRISRPRGLNTTICAGHRKDCPEIIQHKLEMLHQSLEGDEEWIGPCSCLPACATLQYDVEVSRTSFNPQQLAQALSNSSVIYKHSDDHAFIAVGFKSKWLLPLKRRELMDFCDLMAQLGGLFGLMMGASVISLLEILYFSLVRPIFNKLRHSENEQPIRPWVR